MNAPPGWHPQPDGQERWWDGQQWTEHFRDPVASPVPTPTPGDGYPGAQTYGGAYGDPSGQWQPPKRSGMSGGAKGCLIAAAVVVLLVIIGAIAAVVFFARSANEAVQNVQSSFPTGLPTGEGPTGGTTVVVQIGQGFDIGNASVGDGWSLGGSGGFGRPIEGMKATFANGTNQPVVFTMKFSGADAETVCTANGQGDGGAADVTCVPVFGDVPDDAEVQVTSAL